MERMIGGEADAGEHLLTLAGDGPGGFAFDGTNLWIANREGNNVTKMSKTGTKLGTFAVGRKSAYFREFCLVVGSPKRPDRLSPVALAGKRITIDVADVVHDGDKKDIPEGARYSVVREVLGAE